MRVYYKTVRQAREWQSELELQFDAICVIQDVPWRGRVREGRSRRSFLFRGICSHSGPNREEQMRRLIKLRPTARLLLRVNRRVSGNMWVYDRIGLSGMKIAIASGVGILNIFLGKCIVSPQEQC